jgi:hypothetical protein
LKKANASQLRTFRSSSGLTTIDQLYQAAKQEGARFPGIKVSVTSGFSNILAPKIDEQIHQGKLAVDLTIFQTLQDYVRWKKAWSSPSI